ncbi:MAG: MOSC domain-containing protein [Spirochaetaceae bacterium]|nr:MOSC domain-containing protein [Spirochaetaceae bacterium]
MKNQFTVLSLNISTNKGEKKVPVDHVELRVNHGIVGDAHAGDWHRQISMLADEDIDSMRGRGADLHSGDFAENITTRGIALAQLPIGTRLIIGDAELEVTQIGKECHHGCAIRRQVGDCVMPSRGIFCRVISGGSLRRDDTGFAVSE